jgi:hypothetical protein
MAFKELHVDKLLFETQSIEVTEQSYNAFKTLNILLLEALSPVLFFSFSSVAQLLCVSRRKDFKCYTTLTISA